MITVIKLIVGTEIHSSSHVNFSPVFKPFIGFLYYAQMNSELSGGDSDA
jgi:hypothetical protein